MPEQPENQTGSRVRSRIIGATLIIFGLTLFVAIIASVVGNIGS